MSYDTGYRDNVASHRIADSLRAAILDGSYLPGERIRQEDVAARSGASRIPVREALRMLDAEGLVTLVANSGAWVTRLSLDECVETYLIRERLEPLLLRTSMRHLEDAAIDRLAALADEMEAGTGVDAFMRADREFHLSSYAGAASGEMWQIIGRMWNTTQHYRREFTRLAAGSGSASPRGDNPPGDPPVGGLRVPPHPPRGDNPPGDPPVGGLRVPPHPPRGDNPPGDPPSTPRKPGLGVTHLEHRLLLDCIRRRDADDAERVLVTHIRRTRLELVRHPEIFAGESS